MSTLTLRLPTSPLPRRNAGSWILVTGASGALVDLAVATLYWSQQHVPAIRIAQGVAAWVFGPAAYSGGAASALFGVVFYCGVVCTLCALYRAGARRYRCLVRHPWICGSLYGALAYGVVFWVAVPLLGAGVGSTRPGWIGLCALTYALAIGIPSALTARITICRR